MRMEQSTCKCSVPHEFSTITPRQCLSSNKSACCPPDCGSHLGSRPSCDDQHAHGAARPSPPAHALRGRSAAAAVVGCTSHVRGKHERRFDRRAQAARSRARRSVVLAWPAIPSRAVIVLSRVSSAQQSTQHPGKRSAARLPHTRAVLLDAWFLFFFNDIKLPGPRQATQRDTERPLACRIDRMAASTAPRHADRGTTCAARCARRPAAVASLAAQWPGDTCAAATPARVRSNAATAAPNASRPMRMPAGSAATTCSHGRKFSYDHRVCTAAHGRQV